MFYKREIRIFIRCAVAQLRNGNESLARGPLRYAALDARPSGLAPLLRYVAWELPRKVRFDSPRWQYFAPNAAADGSIRRANARG